MKIHQICTLISSFWWKYIQFQLEKYNAVTCKDTEELWKIWRGIDLLFQNWHEKFDEYWLEHSKSLKKVYNQSICLSKKSTEELFFMALKSNAKFEKKLTCGLENHMRNLANFNHSTRKSQNWDFELKIYWGAVCHDNEEWCKIWRGVDLSFQYWHKEFDEFWPNLLKVSKISTFMGSFKPKQKT